MDFSKFDMPAEIGGQKVKNLAEFFREARPGDYEIVIHPGGKQTRLVLNPRAFDGAKNPPPTNKIVGDILIRAPGRFLFVSVEGWRGWIYDRDVVFSEVI